MNKTMTDYSTQLKDRIDYANSVINSYLPREEGYLSELVAAMKYSVQAGGKRLRPVFIDSVFRLMGGADKRREPFMAAMEYLHTYSLVHDDMPEIDNDDMRRGMPTTHKRFGTACGLLAGDGLLHWSVQIALKAFDYAEDEFQKDCIIRAFKIFSEKSGPYGMLGGQSVDVLFTGQNPDRERLDYIYRLKTCALIEGSMMIGAALAGVNKEYIEQFEQIGHCVGMAFQIQDDILDLVGNEQTLGKPLGSDEKNGKTTYVSLFGIDAAKTEVKRLSDEALHILDNLDCRSQNEQYFLKELIEGLVGREY